MNALELAATEVRRSFGLGAVSRDNPRLAGARGNAFDVWVQNEFLPACQLVWNRVTFQQLATRPQRLLAGECPDDWCLIVDAVAAVARWSAFLARAVQHHSRVLKRKPHKTTESALKPLSSLSTLSLPLGQLRKRLTRLSKVDPSDIVSAADYFGPRHHVVQECAGQVLQRGEFIVAFNPELTYAGNHVVRCMIVRLKLVGAELEQYGHQIQAALKTARQFQADFAEQRHNFDAAFERMRSRLLHSPEAQLVESAMALTQLYVGYAPTPIDTTWLELPEELVRRCRKCRFIRPVGEDAYKALDRLSCAMETIMQYYRRMPPGASDLEDAIATGGLVVVEETHEVWWEKRCVPIKWSPRTWDVFWALVESRGRGSVRAENIYESAASVDGSTLPSAITRLKARLPPYLRPYFKRGQKTKSYRVTLPPSRIHLIRNTSAESPAS